MCHIRLLDRQERDLAHLLQDAARLLRLQLGNLNLPQDVLLLLDQRLLLILLLHKLRCVVHLLAHLRFELVQLLHVRLDLRPLIRRLLNTFFLLGEGLGFGELFAVKVGCVINRIGQLLFDFVESLNRCGALKFEVEERFVSIVDVLHKLLVLNL